MYCCSSTDSDTEHTCSEGVEEEEEFPDSSADIEGVERLLQTVELRQSWYQLQYVVLQILEQYCKREIMRCIFKHMAGCK